MTAADGDLELVFVCPPQQSAFMGELLEAVADAAERQGAATRISRSTLGGAQLRSGSVAVVIPHEYLAVDPGVDDALLARTIAFGVEHPGTLSYEMSVAAAPRFGALFEINEHSVAESRRRGLAPMRFVLGYSPIWDHQAVGAARPTDILHLGTLDPRRALILSRIAGDLAPHRTRIVLAPHEPMTKPRPDFLMGKDKWTALAQSSVLLNLHRAGSTAFEWVRCLEAMVNGCVVVSEHSSGFAPLIPGEHLVFASADAIGAVAGLVVSDDARLERMRSAASDFVRQELDMAASVRDLIDRAWDLIPTAPSPSLRPSEMEPAEPPPTGLAEWFPVLSDAEGDRSGSAALVGPSQRMGVRVGGRGTATLSSQRIGSLEPQVQVICAKVPGDGPLSVTMASLRDQDVSMVVSVASTDGYGAGGRGAVRNAALDTLRAAPPLAPWVAVMDSGDEFLPGALSTLLSDACWRVSDDGVPDVVVGLAAHPGGLLNALPPESRRLAFSAYLGRGYLVRTEYLLASGGWTEHPLLEGLTDHVFWRRVAAGANAVLVPQITTRLWTQRPPTRILDRDPDAVWAAVEAVAPIARHRADRHRPYRY